MTRLLPAVLLFLAVHTTAWAQAVAPRPAPVLPPPAYTPGFAPGTPSEPVYTPQGAGAYRGDPLPTTPVPRSPNKRVLPREKDGAPGLWAADGAPQAVMPYRVFDVEVPYAAAARTSEVRKATASCAISIHESVLRLGLHGLIHSLPKDVRQCLALQAYRRCTDGMMDHFEDLKRKAVKYDAEKVRNYQGAQATARASEEAACRGITISDEHRALLDRIFADWNAALTDLGGMD